MRRVLIVLLGFGVFAGYGSAIASARWHGRHGGAGCESREGRWGRGFEREEVRTVAAPAPAAVAPQTIVMPQAAAAPAQQIFLIMPGAQGATAPQVITVPVQAAPAQAPAPASP